MALIEKNGSFLSKWILKPMLGESTLMDGSFTQKMHRIREGIGDRRPWGFIDNQRDLGYIWIAGPGLWMAGLDSSDAEEASRQVYVYPNGRFQQEGTIWKEYRDDVPGRPVYVFKEHWRDEEYIYLYDDTRWEDSGRPMYFRIPLRGGAAQWTFPNPMVWTDVMIVKPQ